MNEQLNKYFLYSWTNTEKIIYFLIDHVISRKDVVSNMCICREYFYLSF